MLIETRTKMLREFGVESTRMYPHPGSNGLYGSDPTYAYPDGFDEKFIVMPLKGLYEKYTPNSSGNKRQWKDFEHYRMSQDLVGRSPAIQVSTWYFMPEVYGPTGPYHLMTRSDPAFGYRNPSGSEVSNWGLPSLDVPDPVSGHFVPEPADLESLKARALKATLPLVKQELLGLSSLIELKDFKSLKITAKSMEGIVSQLRSLLFQASYRVWMRRGSKKLLSTLGEEVVSQYLASAFMWKPLLSDMQGLYSALVGLEKKMNRLVTQSAKTQVKHYTVPLTELQDYSDSYGPYLIDYDPLGRNTRLGLYKSYRYVRSENSKFHMQIAYNYSYMQYQVEHARLLTLLDSFGISKGLNVVWNAIKWSFVIDWFLNVSSWLDRIQPSFMEPVINIHGCLWSIKRKRTISTTFDVLMDPQQPGYRLGLPATVTTETAYRRQTWVPSVGSISLSGLTENQFKLGAALVIATRRRSKRKRS